MSEANHSSAHSSHDNGGHEKQDLEYSWGTWIVPVAILLVLVFTIVVVFLTSAAATGEIEAKRLEGVDAPRAQLLALRAHEDSLLTLAGRDTAGHVRIPVDSAMKILAARAKNP